MRIERIDDMTVKLFITYKDIEARGFKRETYGRTANVVKNSFGL
ncbi:adapter protein MecA [Staphylococcus agnetis]|nr:adapter protein MecA [Staphylococcus agnetis]